MKVNPQPLEVRDEINLRQGIKSSLSDMKVLFASVFVLYKISPESQINYSDEQSSAGRTSINLVDGIASQLGSFFSDQIEESEISNEDLIRIFNSTPLFVQQLEALQVAIQLFWKLGEIKFVGNMASSTERTGGNRFNKTLVFSTNMDIIDNILKDENDGISVFAKNLVFNFLTGQSLNVAQLENKLIRTLTIFSEETQFKIRQGDEEIFFQQEGVYKELINSYTVESNDSHEPVGPFRILKSAIKDNLNYYIFDSRQDGFSLKEGRTISELQQYTTRVNTYLNLTPKRTNLTIINETNTEGVEENSSSSHNIGVNRIYYGAPGTGKSNTIKEIVQGKENFTERITFHPEYDYSSFIGGYKPTSTTEGNIEYKFTPQIFTNIYVKAWNDVEKREHFLVIEEINRGNCAEIFGDIFQLLDRNPEYTITPSKELKEYLETNLTGLGLEGISNGKMKLPDNLTILASMNTSDQSLFPMDSAFKRRWDWEYVPICYEPQTEDAKENKSHSYKVIIDAASNKTFQWIEFIEKVNLNHIIGNRAIGMDKCLGNYFTKANAENEITLDSFINKVIFYLWNDVFKDEENNVFEENTSYESFFPIQTNGKTKLIQLLKRIGVKIENEVEE